VLFTFQNTDETAHALLDFIRFEQQCCGAIAYETSCVNLGGEPQSFWSTGFEFFEA